MAINKIIFGAGCFWSVEAAFRRIEGVTNVTCGYSGGRTDNPTYEAVCSNTTRHRSLMRGVRQIEKSITPTATCGEQKRTTH